MGWLRRLFHKSRIANQIDKELSFHLAQQVNEYIAAGMSPHEASRRARMEFGTLDLVREEIRDTHWETYLGGFIRDLRFALRMLRKAPGFSVVAVLTLALGIGANTAIFSVLETLFLRPLPVQNPQQIVVLGFQSGTSGVASQFSVPEYRDIAMETSGAFSGVYGVKFGIDGLGVGGHADRIKTNFVTGNFFSTLGIKPLAGRFFVSGEGETPNGDPVVVLSYDYWRTRFNSDTSVIGAKVLFDGKPVTIVGVTPDGFQGTSALLNIQAYLPLGMAVLEGVGPDFMQNRTLRNISLGARLLPRRTIPEASAALAVVSRRMAEQNPTEEKSIRLMLFPETSARLALDEGNTAMLVSSIFLGLAAMVLLLACLNVANMLLVRATIREGEMAIRVALGAGRGALIRQLLTESILLALLGASGGVMLGRWTSSMLSNLDLHTESLVHFDFSFDWRVFTYALGAALLTGIVVGVTPAIRVSRTDVNKLLHRAGRNIVGGRNSLRNSLVVAQVASSLMLLIIAGLFLRSLKVAQRSDLGFDPHQVADISMDPGEIGYDATQGLAFYKTLLDRARSLPGVTRAALTSSIPLSYYNDADSLSIESHNSIPGQPLPHAMFSVVTPEYLETLRIPIVRGRSLNDTDRSDSIYVAIINQTMAQRYWSNQDPLGKHFSLGRDPKHFIEVVGVARNSRVMGVTGNIGPGFYVPLQQHYSNGLTSLQTLVVRVNGNPEATVPELEDLARTLAPNLPIFDAQPMIRAIDTLNGLMLYRLGAVLAGALGGLGLLLSVVGVYGVLSYSVSQRKSEFGIRIALGAQPASIAVTMLRQGALLVGVGLSIGIACALATSRVVGSVLAVSPSDPITYVGVTTVLSVVALGACYFPARHAMRQDPMQSLREN